MLTAVGGARRGACRTLLCAASARRVVVRLCDAPPSVSQVYLRRESVLKRSIRIHHSRLVLRKYHRASTSSWSTAQLLLSNAFCTACTPLAARRAVGPSRTPLTGATLHESP